MSSQHDIKTSAEIVDMARLFKKSGRRKTVQAADYRATASLLSIRQNLIYQATVGIDDIDRIAADQPKSVALAVNGLLRQLLNKEFGSLRVHKHRRVFTVGHHSLETLVAGLLRVQYHAKQTDTSTIKPDVLSTDIGLPVTWGVGNSVPEAETERSRRRALKRL